MDPLKNPNNPVDASALSPSKSPRIPGLPGNPLATITAASSTFNDLFQQATTTPLKSLFSKEEEKSSPVQPSPHMPLNTTTQTGSEEPRLSREKLDRSVSPLRPSSEQLEMQERRSFTSSNPEGLGVDVREKPVKVFGPTGSLNGSSPTFSNSMLGHSPHHGGMTSDDSASQPASSRGRRRFDISMPLDQDGNEYRPTQKPLVAHDDPDSQPTPSTSSTATVSKLTAYGKFMERIRQPDAKPMVGEMSEFLNIFQTKSRQGQPELLHDFLSKIQNEYGHLYDNYFEGLEKLIVSKLYPVIFGKDPQHKAEDKRLKRMMVALSWLEFYHLEIPPKDPNLLELAMSELRRMNDYKSPRDKLICVLNACRVIGNVLQTVGGEKTGADDFLPLLIYCVIHSNPLNLKSNVEYIQDYRHPSRMHGEEAYFFMTLCSAVAFIQQITHESLEINEEDYERLYNQHVPPESVDEDTGEGGQEMEMSMRPSAKRHVQKALGLLDQQKLQTYFSSFTFKHESVASPYNLRLREVEEVLEEYHRMTKFLKKMQVVLDQAKK